MNEAKMLADIKREYGYFDIKRKDFDRTVFKLYSDRITLTQCFNRRIKIRRFNEDYKVDVETGELLPYTFTDCKRQKKNLEISINRARNAIDEICEKNRFDFFVSITFNQKYVDRYSAESVRHSFSCVMKRLRRVYGKVSYIAVSEYHADKAIHYHCFMRFERKPKLHYNYKNNIYYFVDDFKKEDCFLVAEKIDGALPTWYLKKYINKNMERPMYRRFSCSRDLVRRKVLAHISLYKMSGIAKSVVMSYGFRLHTSNTWAHSYRYELPHDASGAVGGARSATPAPTDSSIYDINDRNVLELWRIFDSLLDDMYNLQRLKRGQSAEYDGNGKTVEVGGNRQLRFVLD